MRRDAVRGTVERAAARLELELLALRAEGARADRPAAALQAVRGAVHLLRIARRHRTRDGRQHSARAREELGQQLALERLVAERCLLELRMIQRRCLRLVHLTWPPGRGTPPPDCMMFGRTPPRHERVRRVHPRRLPQDSAGDRSTTAVPTRRCAPRAAPGSASRRARCRWLTTLVDGGLGADERFADQRQLRRLRTVRGCLLSLAAASPFTVALFAALGAWPLAGVVVFSTVLSLASLRAMQRGARLGTVAHLNISLGVLTFVVLQASLGGVAAPGQSWVFVPAMYAGLVLGVRSALAYTVVGGLQTLGFAAARVLGRRAALDPAAGRRGGVRGVRAAAVRRGRARVRAVLPERAAPGGAIAPGDQPRAGALARRGARPRRAPRATSSRP